MRTVVAAVIYVVGGTLSIGLPGVSTAEVTSRPPDPAGLEQPDDPTAAGPQRPAFEPVDAAPLTGQSATRRTTVVAQVPALEREALIALYDNTDGHNWTNNDGWLGAPGTECSWFGVSCGGEPTVWWLDLHDNNLVGTLPAELGNLVNLHQLYLADNELAGIIPSGFLNLTSLDDSDGLDLCGNALNTDDLVLRDFLNTRQVGGDWEACQGAPCVLECSGEVPLTAEVGEVVTFIGVATTTNCEGEEGEIYDRWWQFGDGSGGHGATLTWAYAEAGTYTWITHASIEGQECYASGTITVVAGSFPPAEREALVALFNSTNGANWVVNDGWLGAEGTECLWFGVTCHENRTVSLLSLRDNGLTGTIPEELGSLANLEMLALGWNQLTGQIPPELGALQSLTVLGLFGNQLSGTIPIALANLINLQELYLFSNALSGTIPSELGNLGALVNISLEHNELTGTIPPELGNLTNLTDLWLNDNQLTGAVPAELGNLGAVLARLHLEENRLSGSLPAELGNLVNMHELYLADNELAGVIPSGFLNLTSLDDSDGLDLCGNALNTDDLVLRDFLNAKQVGGDWEACQEGGTGSGTEAQVSAPGAEVGLDTGAAVDADGNRVIIWQQSGGAAKAITGNLAVSQGADGIFARVFDMDGNPVGEPIEVDTVTDGEVSDPSVEFDALGNFTVVWEKSASASDGIFARLFGPDLEPVTEAFQLDDGSAVADSPQVATSNAGDFVAVWRAGASKSLQGEDGVFARFFNPDGSAKTDPIRIDLDDPDQVSEPDAATGAAGNAVVVWQKRVASKQDGEDGIFARFFGPDGSPLEDAVQVNTDAVTDAAPPRVSADAAGNAVVVWAQPEIAELGGWDVFARRIDLDGEPEGDPFRVSSRTEGDQVNAAVASNPQGDFAVVWESISTTKQDGEDGIFARFFDAGGDPLGPDYEVVRAEGGLHPVSPEVVLANDGSATVAYTKTMGDDIGQGVFFRYIDVEGQPSTCEEGAATLCLNDDRFQVEVSWRAFDDANGMGQAVPLTDDTGYFWYFDPSNVEMVVKVLDGTGINGHYWVFYGSLSNVEFSITVTDTVTGGSVTYYNPLGHFASVGDTAAIPGGGMKGGHRTAEVLGLLDPEALGLYAELMAAGPSPLGAKRLSSCNPGEATLCLNQSRFQVEVAWEAFDSSTGVGQAVPLSSDTGYFWFFNDANVELVVKVLDGRWLNGHYWVFYGALSNVAYTITITDGETGEVRQYTNPLGTFASVGDTAAFYAP